MGQLLTTVLIWLLALAVPAQGMAAANMLHCGPGHHGEQAAQRGVQSISNDAQPEGHSAHGPARHFAQEAKVVSEIDPNATPLDATDTTQPGKVDDPAKVAKATYKKCSACASCCAALALPSKAVMPPTIDPAREVTAVSPPLAASVVIDEPERPPRLLRA